MVIFADEIPDLDGTEMYLRTKAKEEEQLRRSANEGGDRG
jgi:hypothetical protein